MAKCWWRMAGTHLFAVVLCLFAYRLLRLSGVQAKAPTATAVKQTEYPAQLDLELHPSAADAQRILSSVDGLLNFSSERTGLPIRSHVQGQLIAREAVKERLEANLRKEEIALRLRRSSLVLKKLGLVPRDFNLGSFALNNEKDDSLAGFYDPATKVFYMLDWVPVKAQLPVMAHELTHALQDQYIGLQTWMKGAGTAGEDLSRRKGIDETQIARRTVAEGQAMAVTMDYVLAPYGRTLTDLPAITESAIQKAMQSHTYPAFLRAPRYIRESATFPYTYGLEFVQQVLKKEGKEQSFAGLLRNPPLNTRQLMHPAVYIAAEEISPLSIPSLGPIIGSDYERLDAGTFGEFDVLMFAEQFGSTENARQISAQWRGGYYYAVRRRNPGEGPKLSIASPAVSSLRGQPAAMSDASEPDESLGTVALFYLSRWASPQAARHFARLYASSVEQRYAGATQEPGLRGADQSAGISLAWDTPEGLVSVEGHGTHVLALESFDRTTASNLRRAVLGRQK